MIDLCVLKKLEELDLAKNDFEGILPPCLNNLTSLRFGGNVSSSLIAGLTFLEYIDLSYNSFEGLLSSRLFANHLKLKAIQILSDNNKVDLETIISNSVLFQPEFLVPISKPK